MKRKAFTIAASLLLIVATVPMFGETGLVDGVVASEPPTLVVSVSPSSIDFGSVLPGNSSSVPEGDRTITVENSGNCDALVTVDIMGEERVLSSEALGHGDGVQAVFGPSDYRPIGEGTETVRLNGVAQDPASYTMDYVAGTVTFTDPPAGGALVSMDYEASSTCYSANMTLNDPAVPPEVLAVTYSRVLADGQTAYPVAQIHMPEGYPAGMETAQIIFWAEAVVGGFTFTGTLPRNEERESRYTVSILSPGAASMYVKLTWSTKGDLRLRVYDPSGEMVAEVDESSLADKVEEITIEGLEAGDWQVAAYLESMGRSIDYTIEGVVDY